MESRHKIQCIVTVVATYTRVMQIIEGASLFSQYDQEVELYNCHC